LGLSLEQVVVPDATNGWEGAVFRLRLARLLASLP
jgi:hypothetical protein